MTPNQFIEAFQRFVLANQIHPDEAIVKVADAVHWWDIGRFEYDEENETLIINQKESEQNQ